MPVLQLEERPQPLAHDGVVVDDEDADRSHAASSRTVVPAPGAERISSRPPSRRARSSIEVSPSRRERSSGSAGIEARAVVGRPRARAGSPSRPQPHHDPRRRPRGGPRSAAPPARPAAPRGRGARPPPPAASSDVDTRSARRCSRREHVDVLAQRAAQPVALELRRAQLEDQRAQLLERLARQLLQPGDVRARRVAVAVQQRAGRLGGQHEAEQLLADRVVQLEREPVALGEHRQLAAALVQARVGDRDRGVRGEQLDQLLVGSAPNSAAPSLSVR